jgi:hypothetical protein
MYHVKSVPVEMLEGFLNGLGDNLTFLQIMPLPSGVDNPMCTVVYSAPRGDLSTPRDGVGEMYKCF